MLPGFVLPELHAFASTETL